MFKEPWNSNFSKTGLAVITGVVKSGKITLQKPAKIWDKKTGC